MLIGLTMVILGIIIHSKSNIVNCSGARSSAIGVWVLGLFLMLLSGTYAFSQREKI